MLYLSEFNSQRYLAYAFLATRILYVESDNSQMILGGQARPQARHRPITHYVMMGHVRAQGRLHHVILHVVKLGPQQL